MKKLIIFFIAILMLIPSFALADEKAVPAAEDLSGSCKYDGSRGSGVKGCLRDKDYNTYVTLYTKEYVTISWSEDVPVASVLVEFLRDPGAYTITQLDADGKEITSRDGLAGAINDLEYVSDKTRTVKIVCESTNAIYPCGLKAYGKGEISGRHKWMPTPEKLDYLVVAMHPDDDVLFLGAIMPIYTGEYGYVGASLVMATNNRTRKDEYLNGEWELGQRTYPFCGGFPDIASSSNAPADTKFNKDTVTLYLVRLIRKYKPEVVFSQDLGGEYGHWQHRRLSAWVKKAVPLAAKESYDQTSIDQYGTWQVKKHYIHLYEKNQIKLDVASPLSAFGGKNAFEVATAAFEWHVTQHNGHHWVKNEGVYSLSDFGLAYTTVGSDTEGKNDPFEHTGVISEKIIRKRIESFSMNALSSIRHVAKGEVK